MGILVYQYLFLKTQVQICPSSVMCSTCETRRGSLVGRGPSPMQHHHLAQLACLRFTIQHWITFQQVMGFQNRISFRNYMLSNTPIYGRHWISWHVQIEAQELSVFVIIGLMSLFRSNKDQRRSEVWFRAKKRHLTNDLPNKFLQYCIFFLTYKS